MNKQTIKDCLDLILKVSAEAFPDPEDDNGAMLWNAALQIAQEVGVEVTPQ